MLTSRHALFVLATLALPAVACAPAQEVCKACEAAEATASDAASVEEAVVDRVVNVEASFAAAGLPFEPIGEDNLPSGAFLDFVARTAGLSSASDLRLETYEADGVGFVDVLPVAGSEGALVLARGYSSSGFEHGMMLEAYSAEVEGPVPEGAVGPSYLHMSASAGAGGSWFVNYMARIATSGFGAEQGEGTTLFVYAEDDGMGEVGLMRYCSTAPCVSSYLALACIDVVFDQPCSDCDAFTRLVDALTIEDSQPTAADLACMDPSEKVMVF